LNASVAQEESRMLNVKRMPNSIDACA
jgi:hypothetical protein